MLICFIDILINDHHASEVSMKNKKIAFPLIALCLVIATSIFYLSTPGYEAQAEVVQPYLQASNKITVETLGRNMTVFKPTFPKAGLIFYPGGKVAPEAYVPLLHQLADEHLLCVLVSMPFDLAVFDVNAADGLHEQFPEVTHWYMSGHSLGGSMAATYVSKHLKDFDGLILLAAYSTADLSHTNLEVISIYGSNDQVLNRDKYQENLIHLPSDYKEFILEGGNHAYFGTYGEQKGDGKATLTNSQQIEQTVHLLKDYIIAQKKCHETNS